MRPLAERLLVLMPGASRRTVKQILEHGRVIVEGRAVRRGDQPVPESATIEILPKKATLRRDPPPVKILHEDPHLLVVEKPAGMITVDVTRRGRESIWSSLRRMLRERRPEEEPFLVHRLDEGASGLLVFAKTKAVQRALKAIFERHALDRHYAAIIQGRMQEPRGEFRSHLVETRDRQHRVRSVGHGDPAGVRRTAREAVTRYAVRDERSGLTALEIRLETGRKHQIRVHLSEAGHPLLGDSLYGGPRADRLCLHAWVLGFIHPVTKRPVRAVSPPGPEFEKRFPRAFREPCIGAPR